MLELKLLHSDLGFRNWQISLTVTFGSTSTSIFFSSNLSTSNRSISIRSQADCNLTPFIVYLIVKCSSIHEIQCCSLSSSFRILDYSQFLFFQFWFNCMDRYNCILLHNIFSSDLFPPLFHSFTFYRDFDFCFASLIPSSVMTSSR